MSEAERPGGPFEYPNIDIPKPQVLTDEAGAEHTVAPRDNDGIVNTVLMLGSNLEDTGLVNADHLNLVGHLKRVRSSKIDNYREYDL